MDEASERVPIPGGVNLKGTRYKVQEAEGLIVFAEDGGVWGCRCRISFERRCQCWYLRIDGTGDAAPASHVIAAFDHVRAAYGGSFEGKDGEHMP